jgi:hypothetical protein
MLTASNLWTYSSPFRRWWANSPSPNPEWENIAIWQNNDSPTDLNWLQGWQLVCCGWQRRDWIVSTNRCSRSDMKYWWFLHESVCIMLGNKHRSKRKPQWFYTYLEQEQLQAVCITQTLPPTRLHSVTTEKTTMWINTLTSQFYIHTHISFVPAHQVESILSLSW